MSTRYVRTIRLILETPDAGSATWLAESLARHLKKHDYAVREATVVVPPNALPRPDHEGP